MLNPTKKLDKVMTDIETLKKRSQLLDIFLNYYNHLEGTFKDVPVEWKNTRIRLDKLPAKNPREHLKNQVESLLDVEEVHFLEINSY
jgi:hypothetical protein